MSTEKKEFEVFGLKLAFKPAVGDEIDPEEVVTFLLKEAAEFTSNPTLKNAQIATLVALKLAGEKLKLEKEYRENIVKIEASANDALRFIEEVTPSSH